MNKKQNQFVLDYVAEHSPESFAVKIQKRNRLALEWLQKQYQLFKAGEDYKKIKVFSLGCPHCNFDYDCTGCLWQAGGR